MKKIAILCLGNYYFDARLINMATSLINNSYMVHIVCLQNNDRHSRLYHNLKNIKILPICLKYRGILKYIEFYLRANKQIRKNNYHCIVAGDVYSLASAYFCSNNTKLVYDCREIYSELAAHINKPIHKWILTQYEKYFIKFYSDIIVTAETDESLLKTKFSKYTHLQWHILYNFPKYQPINKKINLRKKYNIPTHHTIVCYQGVIQKHRGIKKLLMVLQKNPTLWACIIGEGEARLLYQKLANQLKISSRVLFINRVPYMNLLEYTAGCDIGWAVIQGVGLSNQFALPNKLFEYGLANLPVVASKLPNLIDLITQHRLGCLVDSQNIIDQLDAIEKLKRENRKQEYHNIIKNNFVWELQNQKFLQIMSSI